MSYFSKHWNGEIEPVWAFWINLVALTGIVYLASLLITELSLSTTPVQDSQIYIAGLLVYALILAPWGVIGTWRACGKHTDKPPSSGTRMMVRLLILGWAYVAGIYVYQERGVIENRIYLALALDSNGGYTLSFEPASKEILVNGGFEIGLADDIKSLYRQHPETTRIAFGTSLGGWIFEAHQLALFIVEKELDTTVLAECSSACTIAYIAGERRTLAAGAYLGFHQFASQVHRDASTGIETSQSVTQTFFELQGVSRDFTSKMFQASADDMWYPDTEALYRGGVIHATASLRPAPEPEAVGGSLDQLLARPEYVAMKLHYPSRYDELLDAVANAYISDQPWYRVQDAAATVMLELLHQSTLYLPDAQVIELTREVEALMRELADEHPMACVQVNDPGAYGGVDLSRLVSPDLAGHYSQVFARAIAAGQRYDRQRYSSNEVSKHFTQLVDQIDQALLSPLVDDLDLSKRENREALCHASLILTHELILAEHGADIVRYLND